MCLLATPVYSCSYEQSLDWLAKAIYFEARGEPLEGQLLVAHTIINRVNSSKFPNNICNVVTQRKPTCQFSWYCTSKAEISFQNLEKFRKIAILAINSHNQREILFFMSKDYKNKWVSSLTLIKTIGNHSFYSL